MFDKCQKFFFSKLVLKGGGRKGTKQFWFPWCYWQMLSPWYEEAYECLGASWWYLLCSCSIKPLSKIWTLRLDVSVGWLLSTLTVYLTDFSQRLLVSGWSRVRWVGIFLLLNLFFLLKCGILHWVQVVCDDGKWELYGLGSDSIGFDIKTNMADYVVM